MQSITFERVSNHTSYSHFVEINGDIIALASLQGPREIRVGVVFGEEHPNDFQRLAIAHLANVATSLDPTVELVFKEGASPFPGNITPKHPFADLCAT
ncbi:hypothetical protein [Bradyrhizobium stylosanthis]|uniref:Uncharacterized protein n=1 Tax=Bradyrhizobium stylosanthis TaxID=1803665 RepID=A0A560DKA3_9BRAD|nr:hypothetical protein [Bradyrhizobium stylosanthis]TWA97540.1 hypothetical protein FBZ96_106599 [Bradyrhizobium stylosanthis]